MCVLVICFSICVRSFGVCKFGPGVIWLCMHIIETSCRAPLQEECPKHHGHKGDPRVTPGTCAAVGERAQVILVLARAPGVGNASHPWILGCTRVRP